MIIDSPITADLSTAVDRAVPERSDAQIQIPNQLIPTVELLRAHTISSSPTQDYQRSFIVEQRTTRNNEVASSSLICTLSKGLYTISWNFGARFDYTKIGSVALDAALQVAISPQTQTICCLYAAIGIQRASGQFRLLVSSVATIVQAWGNLAVAEHQDMTVCLQIEKNI